ncbi:PEP-CTERM protein-sorting domain-containing protein [Alkalimonas amylolytica]|uniref:PEP-CTERM protein-sorting domain-containing protein n=2 Tax=Alkalimonas amylolytica TaxID=152573 RepID=A0A1H4EXY2_ALKAM|nr:PEP-CTERM protein-sorting domain-containing protein [Alkalimonas amylolytica]
MRLLKGLCAVVLSITTATSSASVFDTAMLSDFALFAGASGHSAQAGYLGFGSESDVHGNVAARNPEFGAGSHIHGYAAGMHSVLGDSVQLDGGWQQWQEHQFSELNQQLLRLSQQLEALGGEQTSLQSLHGYHGSGGLNVFQLNPVLMAHQTVEIYGSGDDIFVFNVADYFLMDGGGILLHGINPNKVFFNFHRYNTADEYSHLAAANIGTSNIQGNWLAPNMLFQIGDGATLESTRVWAGAMQLNIQTFIPPPAEQPTPVPAPATLILMLLGLPVLLWRLKQ